MNNKILETLEIAYDRFLRGEYNKKQLTDTLGTALSAIPFEAGDKKFTVEFANEDNGERFFGFRVFPDIDQLDAFCKEVVGDDGSKTIKFQDLVKKWKNMNAWVLEIDAMAFDRATINFTPKELVAITLHEIGHVIYSDEPPEVFYRAFKEAQIRMKATDKATQKIMYSIYMIPLTIACMQRRWLDDNDILKIEIIADRSVTELGYGEHLLSALNKILRVFGNPNSSSSTFYNNVKTSVVWCGLNVADVIKRKDTLRDELYYQGIKTRSNYMKAVSIAVIKVLGFKLRERYHGAVVEASVPMLTDDMMKNYIPHTDIAAFDSFYRRSEVYRNKFESEIANEALFNSRKKINVQLPSQYEIDNISIEIDKITTHHDRTYVLDLIYGLLEKISYFEEVVSRDPMLYRKWDTKIKQMRTDLEGYRQATLNKKQLDKSYKFFVKYPEGYEG